MEKKMNISDFLLGSAGKFPDMDALVFEGRRLSFRALNERVNQLARALISLGISKGGHVGLFSTNCIQCVEVMFAVAKAGGVLVPFNYRSIEEEAKALFDHSEITAIFFEPRYRRLIAAIAPDIETLDNLICFGKGDENIFDYEELISRESIDEPEKISGGEDIALILYTSGTTGFPKGVMLSHRHMVLRIRTRDMDLYKLAEGGVSMMVVPHYHSAGIQGTLKNIHRPMTLVILRQFETRAFLETIAKEKVHACTLVPTMIKRIMDVPDLDRYELSSLKQIRYGAAPMSPGLLKKAMELFPECSFTQGYGMTEGSATTLSVDDHDLSGTPVEIQKKIERLESVGRAVKDVKIKIIDQDDNELPIGEVGQIAIKGPAILSGYWNDPGATTEAIRDGWLQTGDRGRLDGDGYLFVSGREKDIIIRGGVNISPLEIEAVIESHPRVFEAAVIGVPDPEWGETIRAIVAPEPGADITEEEVIEFCGRKLASYKRPASTIFIDSIPKNPTGKVLKRVLRENFGGQEMKKHKEGST